MLLASCLLDAITFDVFVDAEEESVCHVMNGAVFAAMAERNPAMKIFALETVVSRFSDVMWLMEQIMWKSLDRRLAAFLLEEASIEGTDRLKITHETIANHLGSHREVITRMLRYFQNEGMGRLSRGVIEITDADKLEETIGH